MNHNNNNNNRLYQRLVYHRSADMSDVAHVVANAAVERGVYVVGQVRCADGDCGQWNRQWEDDQPRAWVHLVRASEQFTGFSARCSLLVPQPMFVPGLPLGCGLYVFCPVWRTERAAHQSKRGHYAVDSARGAEATRRVLPGVAAHVPVALQRPLARRDVCVCHVRKSTNYPGCEERETAKTGERETDRLRERERITAIKVVPVR